MIEKLAKYLHEECWMAFAKGIHKSEPLLSKERKERWEKECFMPYENLSEEMKQKDRDFVYGLIPIIENHTSDRYLNQYECVKRLVIDYKKHNNLFIAFDFDNTVFDYFGTGETHPKLESLLQFVKVKGFKLILFTGNEGEKLQEIVKYCKEHGYEPDFVNESPVMKTTKPYYNILLDDRAGLNDAYQTLVLTLNILNYDYKY